MLFVGSQVTGLPTPTSVLSSRLLAQHHLPRHSFIALYICIQSHSGDTPSAYTLRLQGQRILVNIHRTSFLSLRPQLTSSKANYSNCTKPTGRPLLQIQKDNGDGEYPHRFIPPGRVLFTNNNVVIDTQDEEDLYRYTTKRWL